MERTETKLFELEVTATGIVSIQAEHARAARDALILALEGADVIVTTGSGAGLVLSGLRTSDDVALLRVDGVDPTAALAQALRTHHGRDA